MAYTTIDKPTDYFNTVLYTGNASTGHAITGVGFQPDWTWIKERSSTSSHFLNDSVRGAGKNIYSNNTSAEGTNTALFTSFDSDGFTIGNTNQGNESGQTYVAWNWLAGGTASSNTDGSITSSVSANTTAGFSIVKYTGTESNATVGHGLGAAPNLIIFKNLVRSDGDWIVGGDSIHSSWENFLYLSGNNAKTDLALFQDTAPTSSVFYLGSDGNINDSAGGIVAYCFAEKKGYSKFGSYTGNGGNQFIYTGFKPALVIEKRSSNTSEWDMYDNKRNTFNSVTKVLKPNASDQEATYSGLNFLSNGFEATGSLNDSGQTLIYMAFAEAPFVTSTGIPTTAR